MCCGGTRVSRRSWSTSGRIRCGGGWWLDRKIIDGCLWKRADTRGKSGGKWKPPAKRQEQKQEQKQEQNQDQEQNQQQRAGAPAPHSFQLHTTTTPRETEKADHVSMIGLYLCRQRPTLPHTFACSTIGPAGLNYRVRDGNGWIPRGKITDNLIARSRARSF